MPQHLLQTLLNLQVNDLKTKNPDLRIPSADTIFNYIKNNNIEDALSAFRKMNFKIFKMTKLENTVHDILLVFMTFHFMETKILPEFGNKTKEWQFME